MLHYSKIVIEFFFDKDNMMADDFANLFLHVMVEECWTVLSWVNSSDHKKILSSLLWLSPDDSLLIYIYKISTVTLG